MNPQEETPMHQLTHSLKSLSSAEDFLHFFGVPYDPHVVHVNRLHILKRFTQYLRREADLAELDEIEMFRRYRTLLQQAVADFTHSTAQKEKVFKVFQDADGARVSLDTLRDSLADRRMAA
jgi:nitrogenase-stabilizing/protective protein